MTQLNLSIAIGDYDRTRPLIDGAVRMDGIDPVFMLLEPEEIFFRAFRHAEFDICELSLSSFTVKTALGECPYIGVPVFLSRAFRHTSISVRTDRIANPSDLRGRRVGVPEYQLTACVWARAILEDDFGVKPSEISWVRGGLEQPGRLEKIELQLPEGVRVDPIPAGATLSEMLLTGEIDAIISPRIPSCQQRGAPDIGWLFRDPIEAAVDYFRRTGVFPIMHLLGVRRELADRHPWLPAAVLKAFEHAKTLALRRLDDTSATKVTLPFVEEQIRTAKALMGEDYWPYGLASNRAALGAFLRHHHAQGLSRRLLTVDELFHPGTAETYRI
jgi:4,5-dihydroxyphthalate decarboxylase